ncbi:MAG: GIY-YIG nuclease family protein [Bacteroidetes bacterium]|nr:GIY-YIG nuclease family protein [Bacteroidota bacterium]
MFAIIDIETTGGSPGRDRITEICIIQHDGLSVTNVFTTLINPERWIPEYITKITNITNQMVENAPKFYQVAKQIIELTEGRIFVAHNVAFDYGFVKSEYKSLGYNFDREQLCTVKLSRKLIPGKKSYSLGNLCESIGIDIAADERHRAEGDAVATAKLFDILLAKKSEHKVLRSKGLEEINTSRLDKVKVEILKRLPEECGVYYYLGKDGEILYIGKSRNMRSRAMQHFASKEPKSRRWQNELYDVDFVKTGSELIALLLESEEIKKHKPFFNRARKKSSFTHAIDWKKDKSGAIRYDIVPSEEAEQPLQFYTNYTSAREVLNTWIDEYRLCLHMCGIYSGHGDEESRAGVSCFNYEIKKCVGICCAEEEAEDYNKRAGEPLKHFLISSGDFVLFDTGREAHEQSILLIENGSFAGYGYVDASDSFSSPEELRGMVKRMPFHPDVNDLVRGWMKRNPKVKRIPI